MRLLQSNPSIKTYVIACNQNQCSIGKAAFKRKFATFGIYTNQCQKDDLVGGGGANLAFMIGSLFYSNFMNETSQVERNWE